MHYPNYISLPSSKCVDKLFTDFSGGFDPDTETADLPASTARFCTNLTAAFNSLTPSIGLSDDNFALPAGTLKVWYFEQAQTFFAIDSSFQLYSKSAGNSSFTAVTDAVFNTMPEFFVLKIQNYFRAVFSAPGEPLIVWRSNSETYSVIADLDISQAVFFDGSLFAISHSSPYIHRSAVTELTDWNFSEKESFDLSAIGCLRKLVVTGNSLAVFGDRGIAKIGRYDSSLSAAVVFISPGDIFKDTVAAVGDSIFFTTDKALFSYNGVDTVKLIRRLALSDPFAFASRDGYTLRKRLRCRDHLRSAPPRTASLYPLPLQQPARPFSDKQLCQSTRFGRLDFSRDLFLQAGPYPQPLFKMQLSRFGHHKQGKLLPDLYCDPFGQYGKNTRRYHRKRFYLFIFNTPRTRK